ncbi:MAG TPA: vitamin K epoxide reductase family protein [Gemmatimonadales bacterium]|nr:vitamin K epoxide reductase family protein [Gemmatimonadales bacterium]
MRDNPVRYRMAIAVLALVAGLVATYLHLWKIGAVGPLSCTGGGGCMVAQMSQYGWFPTPDIPFLGRPGWRGVDVALIGAVGYGLLTALAAIGTLPRFAHRRGVTTLMLAGIVAAVLFTWRLKYGEWVALRVFCIWCFESFVTIHLCLLLALLDRRRLAREAAPA